MNQGILPGGWQKILTVGPVTLATKGPEKEPDKEPDKDLKEPSPHVPACACCYYNESVMLIPDDPGSRTCGWFWDEQRRSTGQENCWVWWHGHAPHAPFPYPNQKQGPEEDPLVDGGWDLMGMRQGLVNDPAA